MYFSCFARFGKKVFSYSIFISDKDIISPMATNATIAATTALASFTYGTFIFILNISDCI